jgi:hypothetical protein
MLTHSTIEGLKSLRLPAMASGLLEQREHPDYHELSASRTASGYSSSGTPAASEPSTRTSLKAAKLRSGAVVEDVDFSKTRGLDKTALLVTGEFTLGGQPPPGDDRRTHRRRQDVHRLRHLPTTPSATVASALYVRVPRLLDDLSVARADGRLARVMATPRAHRRRDPR